MMRREEAIRTRLMADDRKAENSQQSCNVTLENSRAMRGGGRQNPTSSKLAANWGAYLDLIGASGRLLAEFGMSEKRLRDTF